MILSVLAMKRTFWSILAVLLLLVNGGCITKLCDNPWLMPVTIPLDVATSPIQVVGFGAFLCAYYDPMRSGEISVTITDNEDRPVTNATLYVDTCVHYGIGYVYDSDYHHYEARTDASGIASVKFDFRWSDIDWYVKTPEHHCDWDKSRFSERVEDGCKLKRVLKFLPKRNAAPMYCQGNSVNGWGSKHDYLRLPKKDFKFSLGDTKPVKCKNVETNGSVVVESFEPIGFDMKKGLFVRPWGGINGNPAGEVADFKIVRFHAKTSLTDVYYGWLEFPDGCGAYKMTNTTDRTFLKTYEADTNAVFVTRIPYEYYHDTNHWWETKTILSTNEYMVCRTRAQFDTAGAITNCNYSKVNGEVYIGREFYFDSLIFNPTPNDPNLEYDSDRNLAR